MKVVEFGLEFTHPKLDTLKEEGGVFYCHLDTFENTQPGWWDLKIEVSNDHIFISRNDTSETWKDIEAIKDILDKECKYQVDEP